MDWIIIGICIAIGLYVAPIVLALVVGGVGLILWGVSTFITTVWEHLKEIFNKGKRK